MKLVDVEKFVQVINQQGVTIIDEATMKVVEREDIGHFVILYDNEPELYSMDDAEPKKRGRKSTKKTSTKEKKSYEIGSADPINNYDDFLRLIAKKLRITEQSTAILANDGWWICPITRELTELRPMIVKQDKNGYLAYIKKNPLCKFSEDLLKGKSKYNFTYSSFALLHEILVESNFTRFVPKSIFRHKKNRGNLGVLKSIVSQSELLMRTRIKIGNNDIAIIVNTLGKRFFREEKERLLKIKIAKKQGKRPEDIEISPEEIEAKLGEINVLKEMSDTFKTIQKKAEADGVVIKNEKTFEPYKQTYIPNFATYQMVSIYMDICDLEKRTNASMAAMVKETKLWTHYLVGIKGCGEVSAAHIITSFDVYNTEHPSSFIRYVGLDQVPVTPTRLDGSEITNAMATNVIKLLFRDYELITQRADAFNDEVSEDNFHIYSTDSLKSYKDFHIIENIYNDYHSAFEDAEVSKDSDEDRYNDITDDILVVIQDNMDANTLFYRIIENFDVFEVQNEMNEKVPVIRKRARTMSDKEITTYISKEGKIKTKYCLGYNSPLKARLLGVLFNSFLYSPGCGYDKIYRDYKDQLQRRPDLVEKVKEGKNPPFHAMARRRTMQIFLEDLWLAWRQLEGLPINGGTYAEGKLNKFHRQGQRPTLLEEPTKDKKKVKVFY